MTATVGCCPGCDGSKKLLVPLHGDKGGRLLCLQCGINWHAEHGRRRKLGRIVVKAMKAYFAAGGAWGDIDRLKLAALGISLFQWEEDALGADVGDITTELLEAALRLTHPDKHPPERQESAQRVTSELLALRPFTFPAPKEKPQAARDDSLQGQPAPDTKPLRAGFPCELCLHEIPHYYCNACRDEWNKRRRAERERERAKQRARYAQRRNRQLLMRGDATCSVCGTAFKSKRPDSRYCSAACRQRAHRARVTHKTSSTPATSSSRHAVEAAP